MNIVVRTGRREENLKRGFSLTTGAIMVLKSDLVNKKRVFKALPIKYSNSPPVNKVQDHGREVLGIRTSYIDREEKKGIESSQCTN